MKRQFTRKFRELFLFAGLLTASSVFAAKPIKTLILTGQNNHNWKVSSVVMKQILENSGLFQADILVSPGQGEDMSSFIVDFTPYSLVIVDYNGDHWPDKTKDNFVAFARKGGGIVVYHAANNSFPDWDDYSRICALGGWEGRNEKSGPYVYWNDGALVRDMSPGAGGSHGRQHEYVLNARNKKHPIIKGLPLEWLHGLDELYDRMRGPGNIRDILYTAYSDKSTGGSGREEPLVFTVNYGKARVFHTMLGHAGESPEQNPAMQCAGFQVLLLRGAEWAATGKVTQKVPADFPSATALKARPDYK